MPEISLEKSQQQADALMMFIPTIDLLIKANMIDLEYLNICRNDIDARALRAESLSVIYYNPKAIKCKRAEADFMGAIIHLFKTRKAVMDAYEEPDESKHREKIINEILGIV